jgi:hypothetical protein
MNFAYNIQGESVPFNSQRWFAIVLAVLAADLHGVWHSLHLSSSIWQEAGFLTIIFTNIKTPPKLHSNLSFIGVKVLCILIVGGVLWLYRLP